VRCDFVGRVDPASCLAFRKSSDLTARINEQLYSRAHLAAAYPPDFSDYFVAAALFAAHIFFVAAMIAALPAALSLRFRFGAAFEVGFAVGVVDTWGSCLPFIAAQLLRWAAAMAFRPAALIFRRGGLSGAVVRADSDGSPEKEHAEFGYLSVNAAFLLFETKYCGRYHFFCEFWRRHVVALLSSRTSNPRPSQTAFQSLLRRSK
jgi:hypothetical protein